MNSYICSQVQGGDGEGRRDWDEERGTGKEGGEVRRGRGKKGLPVLRVCSLFHTVCCATFLQKLSIHAGSVSANGIMRFTWAHAAGEAEYVVTCELRDFRVERGNCGWGGQGSGGKGGFDKVV